MKLKILVALIVLTIAWMWKCYADEPESDKIEIHVIIKKPFNVAKFFDYLEKEYKITPSENQDEETLTVEEKPAEVQEEAQ